MKSTFTDLEKSLIEQQLSESPPPARIGWEDSDLDLLSTGSLTHKPKLAYVNRILRTEKTKENRTRRQKKLELEQPGVTEARAVAALLIENDFITQAEYDAKVAELETETDPLT